jgi:hypothetical protein
MRLTTILFATLITGVASTGFACTLPPLVAIPAKDKIGDKTVQVQAEVSAYFDAMKVYTECVQAELAAAGGDAAPTMVKSVLVQRNNAAVAEVNAVIKIFGDSVGTAQSGPAPGTPPAAPTNRRGSR